MKDCGLYTWWHEKNTVNIIVVQWWKVHIFIYKEKEDQGIISLLEPSKILMFPHSSVLQPTLGQTVFFSSR